MQSEVNQEENLNTTDFDEHFAKISSYIVDTLHGVPLEMTEDEKEQFRIQVISNQYAERLLSEALEKYFLGREAFFLQQREISKIFT